MYSTTPDMDSILPPVTKGYTIYTKSGCTFCTKAKTMLRNEPVTMVDCDDALIESRAEFFELLRSYGMSSTHTTFPLIFYNAVFLGGYTQTRAFYADSMFIEQDV